MKLRKTYLLMVALAIFIVVLVGCNSSDTTDEAVKEDEEGGELRVALNAQPPTIDPVISTATASRDVALQIFEPLVTVNSNLQPEPMLAEKYELSDDGKVITFHLREGVMFHNGEEMTSEDVVASMKRWQEISSRAKTAFGNDEFKADGDYTVLLEMEKRNKTALSVLSSTTQFPAIMPKEVVDSAESDGVTEYVGTAPFKFEEWKQDKHIKLTKHEDYTSRENESDGSAGKREALVDEIYFEIVPDSNTRVSGMLSGEYDIGTVIPFDNFDQIENDENLKTYMGSEGFNLLVFNKKTGPFSNVKVRQAVAAGLDHDAILEASLSDEQFYDLNPGLMLEEQTDWYTDAGSEFYNQKDPKKAKKLLEEADYNNEPVTLLTSRDYDDFYNSSIVIKEQLEAIGMSVDLEVLDWASVTEKQQSPEEYDAFVTGFGINTDPTQLIFLDSKNEWAGFSDSPEIDQLIEEIRSSSSDEEAKIKSEELQLEAWDYMPVLKLGDKNFLYAISDDVEGFEDFIGMNFWNVKKTK